MVESIDTVPDCVKNEMIKESQKQGDNFTKENQKDALAKLFRNCGSKSDSVKICDGCRKEKSLYYQKLCKECYQKRVKNYVKNYDMDEDVLKILDDLSVKSHFRQGKYVSQHERELNEDKKSLGNILGHAIFLIEKKIKSLEKELARAFKAKKQGEYNRILVLIDKKKGDVEKVKGELRKRGIIDMDQNKLRIAIDKIEAEMKEKGITNSEERETYYRMRFMGEMSTGTVKAKQDLQDALLKIKNKIIDFEKDRIRSDASIFKQGIAKKKENESRSIFFRQYRPLEKLREVTKTRGKLSSATIAGMEYSEGMLKVSFNWEGKGEVEYGYDVGPDFYDRMAKSQSKGKFLWSELRGKSPGYVIDNPRKMTPGGVGGSIVPYTKLTKRNVQGDEFKKLQKHYAKQLKGKVKVVANMPFVRQKQKIISRQSKPYKGKASANDFYWFKISDLSDDIRWCVPTMSLPMTDYPVREHIRSGKLVKTHERGIQIDKIKSAINQLNEAEKERKLNPAQKRRRSELKKKLKKVKAEKIKAETPPKEPKKKVVIPKKELTEEQMTQRILTLEGLVKRFPERYSMELKGLESKLSTIHRERRRAVSQPSLENPIENKIRELKQKGMFTKQELQVWLMSNAGITEIPKYMKAWDKIKMIDTPKEDAIPIKGHMRGGKWVQGHDRKGNKAEEIKKKIKSKSLEKTPIPKGEAGAESSKIEKTFAKWKAERSGEKREPAQISEEKRRKEIDKQARATKATAPPEPREEAIQKLIEETGMERKHAEERIAKLMGLSPEQAKKKAEVKAHEIKFKEQNKELGEKLVALNQINAKLDIIPLKNIISLFVKAFTLMATQKDPQVYLKLFYGHYQKLKNDKKMVVKQKRELLTGIEKIQRELEALSKKKREAGDFEYISAAVDQCAKRAVAKSGGKGNYNSEVANCIRVIGIRRRQAGLASRPQGTAREERRGARRERTQDRTRPARRQARNRERREAFEAEQTRLREQTEAVREREAERAREVRVRITAGFIRNIGEVANYIAIGNYQSATQILRDQFDKMHQISNDELRADIEQRLQQAARTLANRVDASNAAVLSSIRTHANTFRHYIEGGTLEDARRELSNANSDSNRIFGDIDAQRRANALVFEMQEKYDERVEREEQAQAVVMSPEVQRARARAREQRVENLRRRGRLNAESNVSGLNEAEGGSVIHIPISESSSREQYEYQPGVFRSLNEGEYIFRQGYYYEHATAGRSWRRPVVRGGIPTAQRVTRRASSGTSRSSRIETAAQHAARSSMRSRHGPRIRWRMRIRLGSRIYRSLDEIQSSDLREGARLNLSVRAKKDYDFENPDFDPSKREAPPHSLGGNKRRIVIRKGADVGGASFSIQRHRTTGLYLYLNLLKVEDASHRGRGASATALNPVTMMADRLGLVVGGSPSPLDRGSEVAPSHLSEAEKRVWRNNNSQQLDAMYASWGGIRNYEYGGSMARFPQTERIGGRISDLKKRFDAIPKLVFYHYPENLQEVAGEFFYYDPDKDMYYHLYFPDKKVK